jgi:hypothetical protein
MTRAQVFLVSADSVWGPKLINLDPIARTMADDGWGG